MDGMKRVYELLIIFLTRSWEADMWHPLYNQKNNE